MTVQVYLEIPNGEKLAEALHSKVMSILGSSIYVFSFDYNGRCCYLGEREIVSWDLKVGTCTGFNAFFQKIIEFGYLSLAGSSLHYILERHIFLLCSVSFPSLTFVGGTKV